MNQNGWGAEDVDMESHSSVDLTQEPLFLIVTSTWGEGNPPDRADDFWEKFKSSERPALNNSRFSAPSLEDTNYADFCEMGKLFDARLDELGAERIAARVDYEDPAEEWFRVVTMRLEKMEKEVFTSTVTTLSAKLSTELKS